MLKLFNALTNILAKRRELYTKKAVTNKCNCLIFCGATRNRTGDTRIFSPLLYQLSYGTVVLFNGCKDTDFFLICNSLVKILPKFIH